jgi:hypothetical protein
MRKKVRFLFFGKKAWDQRIRLAGFFMRDIRSDGVRVYVRRVVTADDAEKTLRALTRTQNEEAWSNFCYGNIDLKIAKPICDVLWPPAPRLPLSKELLL